jgi:cobalt-precorrin 5A hydrolase
MKLLMVACSIQAYKRMQKLKKIWTAQEDHEIIEIVKCKSLPAVSDARKLRECVGEWFFKVDAIIFFAAAGIAVRTIAPYLQHKSKDPAVLVMDETGKFIISLLSGHAGGANELTQQIARMSGAIPVITTATDCEEKFAVDDFARKNHLTILDWNLAKQISVDILEGEEVGIFSDYEMTGVCPEELVRSKWTKRMIRISCQDGIRNGQTLQLIPPFVIAGIGCRKGISQECVEEAVRQCLYEARIMPQALSAVATIDLKKNENGLRSFCEEKHLDFFCFDAETLNRQEGNFSESKFVKQITGVDNVCERSAVAAGGRIICKKKIYEGVTVALAIKKGRIVF